MICHQHRVCQIGRAIAALAWVFLGSGSSLAEAELSYVSTVCLQIAPQHDVLTLDIYGHAAGTYAHPRTPEQEEPWNFWVEVTWRGYLSDNETLIYTLFGTGESRQISDGETVLLDVVVINDTKNLLPLFNRNPFVRFLGQLSRHTGAGRFALDGLGAFEYRNGGTMALTDCPTAMD